MAGMKLVDLAKTIRSKNAGVDKITFDIIFEDAQAYERVKKSGAVDREEVGRLYGIGLDRITDFVFFDPALAVKFTIYRSVASGSPGDTDILGCQQYAPLMDVEIP